MKTRATVLILVSALAACGGRSVGESGGGAGDGGDGVDAGSGSDAGGGGDDGGGGGTACPATPPFNGSACARVGLECEWGTNADPYCDVLMRCTTSGWLSNNGGGGGGGACAISPDAGACAPTYASVPRGQTCAADGASCTYAEGACYCVGVGGPQPPPGTSATWHCRDATPGCPEPRPRIGAACASAGLQCDYGSCIVSGGVMLVCTDGTWHDEPVPCPL